jgi:hypothetical protein
MLVPIVSAGIRKDGQPPLAALTSSVQMTLDLSIRTVPQRIQFLQDLEIVNRPVSGSEDGPDLLPIEPEEELLVFLLLYPVIHIVGLHLRWAPSQIICGDFQPAGGRLLGQGSQKMGFIGQSGRFQAVERDVLHLDQVMAAVH